MLKITIACVGKLKEDYLRSAEAEFVKRLGAYCQLEIKCIPEEKMPENASPAAEQQVLQKETERVLKLIDDHSYVVLLDLKGKEISSPQLAEKLDRWMVEGVSHLTFVIGGPFGYTDDLRRRADFRWSFSPLTFTHQMIRVLLLEQIYRAFKILRNEKYHH
ncbi:MAG: 23S rRNA (pseudouridine(1915)-N(3))-methyltransferase RlmH [Acidaminococcus provencensis]|jgi:23S rRNA (pseudouridine1915-N3)-methyltransferase|uniref:23S rRNA (pseudouridine(1915)-N(3))-methyltransferase RlmH n=1 Tax=Acidaminococcus TaxID=904 RepID=UPI000CF89803|nr:MULTISPECIES: 23S rRNA (pseudouridine(1915)-N(3))-methyltransferase RlmH [Acidaminococcus]MCH4096424.1 23S rRNA (pseudouridine(1915)-N(3))-methyltransferase RlmH [Acidaminococcus provencensis]RHK02898.1 23S rRNA (pseudouridine(1915)-N(3))-methyltransferase RlmH [Acidaminococcus sp. AM05-11]